MVMNNIPHELEGLKLKFYEKVQLKNAFEGDYVRGAAPAAHSLRRGGGKGTPPSSAPPPQLIGGCLISGCLPYITWHGCGRLPGATGEISSPYYARSPCAAWSTKWQ